MEAEDLLQKHGLLEGDIAAQSERVGALNAAALRFSQLQGESRVWVGVRVETFRAGANKSRIIAERVVRSELPVFGGIQAQTTIRDSTGRITALRGRLDLTTSSCFEILQ